MAAPVPNTSFMNSLDAEVSSIPPALEVGLNFPKFNKKEFSYSYAKQVEIMTKNFEHFIKGIQAADQLEMSEKKRQNGTNMRRARSLDALYSPNWKNHTTTLKETEPGPSRSSDETSGGINGTDPNEFDKCFPSPIMTVSSSPCNCNNEALKKRVDTMCTFLHAIFLNQMEIVGKNYQAQMETMKKVEDVQSVVEEEFDAELESIEAELLHVKTVTLKNLQNRMNTLEQSFGSINHFLTTSNNTIDKLEKIANSLAGNSDQLRQLVVKIPDSVTSQNPPVECQPGHQTGSNDYVPKPPVTDSSSSDEEEPSDVNQHEPDEDESGNGESLPLIVDNLLTDNYEGDSDDEDYADYGNFYDDENFGSNSDSDEKEGSPIIYI